MKIYSKLSPALFTAILVTVTVFAQPSGGPLTALNRSSTKSREIQDSAHIYDVAPDGQGEATGDRLNAPTTLAAAIAKALTELQRKFPQFESDSQNLALEPRGLLQSIELKNYRPISALPVRGPLPTELPSSEADRCKRFTHRVPISHLPQNSGARFFAHPSARAECG